MKARLFALLLGTVAALAGIELGLAALGAVTSRRYAPRAPAGAGPTTVLCVGDSFTLGIGAPPGRSYPDQLASILNAEGQRYRVVNAGRAAANTAMARTILSEQAARFKPRFVVLMIGPNNYWNLTGYRPPGFWDSAWRNVRMLRLLNLLSHQWALPVQPGFQEASPARGDLRGSEVLWFPKSAAADPLEAMLLSGEPPDVVLRAGRARMRERPKDPLVPFVMGKALLIARRVPEAEALFEKSAALAPNDASLTFKIAWAYLRSHPRRHEGWRWAKRGRRQEPESPDFPLLLLYSQRAAPAGAAAPDGPWLEEIQRHRRLGHRLRYWQALEGKTPDGSLAGALRFTGDPSKGTDAWIRADMAAIARECRGLGISLILMNYPNPTRFEGYRELAAQEDVEFVDNEAAFDRLRREGRADAYFSPDHHCNAEGYGLIARDLAKRIAALSGR